MILAEKFLIESQGASVEHLGLGEPALDGVEMAQIVNPRCNVRMFGAKELLPCLKGTLRQSLGLVEALQRLVDLGERNTDRGRFRIAAGVGLLEDRQRSFV